MFLVCLFRFARHQDNDSDNETTSTRPGSGVRFAGTTEHAPAPAPQRERVLDTEDVARGPLSGISRLLDSPRVMKRLQVNYTSAIWKYMYVLSRSTVKNTTQLLIEYYKYSNKTNVQYYKYYEKSCFAFNRYYIFQIIFKILFSSPQY